MYLSPDSPLVRYREFSDCVYETFGAGSFLSASLDKVTTDKKWLSNKIDWPQMYMNNLVAFKCVLGESSAHTTPLPKKSIKQVSFKIVTTAKLHLRCWAQVVTRSLKLGVSKVRAVLE